MIPEGTDAPEFEAPAWIDGERRRVALEEFVGRDVVVLAFYPADFNPACDAESDLDELDLFTMQKDVTVLAVGPDSLYSHAAFADAYGLRVPMLADTRREVAEAYDVAFEDEHGQYLVERAVFVLDHDGVIRYAWSTRDLSELPRVEAIKDAIADTGGDDTAFARYRVGHAHYIEGRRAFTSAMGSYRDSEWMIAQSDFKRAREEFEAAADHFESSVRFVDDESLERYYDRVQEKATALWQAADWLGRSASEYASGSGARGQQLRDDAERPLESARDLGEPVDPDDWPPDPDEGYGDGRERILPEDGETPAASLRVDVDEAAAGDGARGAPGDRSDDGAGAAADGEDAIDDAELEAIEAEIASSQPEDPAGGEVAETPTSVVDAPPERVDGDATDHDAAGDDAAGSGTGPTGGAASRDGEEPGSDGEPSADDEPASDGERRGGSDADGGDADDGDADGEIAADDLAALAAEMEASQSAAEEAMRRRADEDESNAAAGGPDDALDDAADAGPDERPPADPHADLVRGSGGPAPGVSGSLEPDDPADGEATDDGPDLAEPAGASDEDLAAVPTTDELDDADPDGESTPGRESADGESGSDAEDDGV